MRRLASLLFIVAAALTTHGAPSQTPKEPWEWTDEERLAHLADRDARAARLSAHQTAKRENDLADDAVPGGDVLLDVVRGKRDPHLFFSWELFDHLILIGYPDDVRSREAFRTNLEDQAKAVGGLPENFWERLGTITAVFRADQLRERTTATMPDSAQRTAELEVLSKLICSDRHLSLQEATAEFGPWFEKFLYKAVAPGLASFRYRDPDRSAALYVGRGCK